MTTGRTWWWVVLLTTACGESVDSFGEPSSPGVVRFDDDGAAQLVAPTMPPPDEVEVAVAPVREAWPPIRPPEGQREREQPFDWPFEAQGRRGAVAEVEVGTSVDTRIVDPDLLR